MDRKLFRIFFFFTDAKVGIFEMIKLVLSGRADGLLFLHGIFYRKKKAALADSFCILI